VAIDTRERGSLRAVAFIALCALWTINLGLGTRGIWFAYGIAVPAMLLLIGGRRLIRIVGAIVVAAAIGALMFMLLTANPASESGALGSVTLPIERLQTLTSREVLWELSWNAIAQHPLLGLGPMHFATLKSHVGAHPHNWAMQVASEWGLPALVVLLYALTRVAKRLRRAHVSGQGFSTEAALAIAVAVVYGLVDGNLVMPVSQTATALALGLALGCLEGGPDSRFHRGSQTVAISTITAAAAVAICAFAADSLADQPRTTAAFRAEYPRDWLVPRFWEQGLLWPPSESEAAH